MNTSKMGKIQTITIEILEIYNLLQHTFLHVPKVLVEILAPVLAPDLRSGLKAH